ncbi:aldehyde dehydrogenase family protein [Legionella yabuuchiae]|uniref:aldehyde dehydrogenase family protein n=1 Tax=Legionella yabuuchiae TaxID=376727 RepID=UPI0010560E1B|nr:aldehyde dehydrogenase family protein [Legionella yabuuchiae]
MTDLFKTYSPIDHSVYVERAFAREHEIHNALTLAVRAEWNWRKLPLETRQQYCSRAIDALVAKKAIIAEEICWQMGRPIQYAEGEVHGLEERARYMISISDDALRTRPLPAKEGFIRYIKREPLGVALVIAPWNYPYLTAVNAVIPALLAGNSVILKHSIQTPLVAERFAEAFFEADLPEGVFQYLHLTHKDTEKMIQSPEIQYVSFTGSVAGGKMVEQAAAGRFLQVGLELGGKDPAYIRADADLDNAVATVVDGAFFNSGQSCCGIERLYVHQDVYQEVIDKVVALTQQYQLGRPDELQTTLGPMVKASSADFVRQQIQEALNDGAKTHIDERDFILDQPGSAYKAPQILTGVTHQMRIMTEESFGPVLGVMPVTSDEEAITLMNDCAYGLTAAVFTRDIEAGIVIGEQLETGTFFINRCDYLDPALAWTGVKNSGRGCSLSNLGFDSLTRPKSFHLKQPE